MESTQENKMGVMPMNKLLMSIALPIMISMSVQALYTMVDSIYVSRLGEAALTATSLGLPVMTMLSAVANGVAVGMNAMLSKALGQKDQKGVNESATAAIFISVVSYIFAIIASFTLVQMYLRSQTTDASIFSLGNTYLSICVGLSFGIFGQTIFERFLISTGKTMLSMATQAVGAIVNIVLDPILIFGYFGAPAMGIKGAAIATVIGQCTAFGLAIFFNYKFNKEISIKIGKPKLYAIKQILAVGIPTTIMQMLTSIMFIFFNMILAQFTTTAVAVFGVCRNITTFFYMLANALCSAVVPIIAYNYGAKNKERIKSVMKLGYIYVTVIMTIGTILFLSTPLTFLKMFNATDQMIEIGLVGVRLITCSFIFAGIRLMSSTIMQALGHGGNSMIVSFTREFVTLLPIAYLFSQIGDLTLVWFSVPIADLIAATLAVLLLRRVYKQKIDVLEETEERKEELALEGN